MEGRKREGFKRYMELFALQTKMDFNWLFRNFGMASIIIISDIISCLASSAGMFFVAFRFDGIGGLSSYEVLFMLSFNIVINGFMLLIFGGANNAHISRVIGRGQIDHMMIQPLSLKAQVITGGLIPFTGSGQLISGIILMIFAVIKMDIQVDFMWIVMLLGTIVLTLVLLVSLSYLLSSLAFYAPSACEEIAMYVLDESSEISSIPLGNIPKILQMLLVTVIPIGLFAWFPSLNLISKTPLGLPNLYQGIVVIFVFSVTYIVFKKGFDYYVRFGINRYFAGGFRR